MKKSMFRLFKTQIFSISLLLLFVSIQSCYSKNISTESSKKWNFSRSILVHNSGAQATDAVVAVELTADKFDYSLAKSDGSDIRFSISSKQIANTGLSYWIEQWNKNGISRIWVKIPTLAQGTNTKLSMFYGNNAAAAVSNGEKTFLFFDDFNDNNFTDKWTNISIATVVEEGGLLKLKEADGENGMIMSNFDITGKMIVRTTYQRENGERHWVRSGISGWNQWLSWGDYYTTDGYADGYLMIFDKDVKKLLQRNVTLHPDGEIHKLSYCYDGSKLIGKRDNDTVEYTMPNAVSKLGFMTLDNDAFDMFDFVTVSNYIFPEPTVTVGVQKNRK